jgi:membrane protein implicated in regulation of membrane protease activity
MNIPIVDYVLACVSALIAGALFGAGYAGVVARGDPYLNIIFWLIIAVTIFRTVRRALKKQEAQSDEEKNA